ncbi:chaplin [Streptomyces sp. NPDC051940]|uniref:chaplin n=1 Tax=Streptomyces sp. NPDC051940 TaxID=3155675 RepID=UPI003426FEB7
MKTAKKTAFVLAVAGLATGASAAAAFAAPAEANASDNAGVLSGNVAQAEVVSPVNIVGNTITAVGAHNSAYDNTGTN